MKTFTVIASIFIIEICVTSNRKKISVNSVYIDDFDGSAATLLCLKTEVVLVKSILKRNYFQCLEFGYLLSSYITHNTWNSPIYIFNYVFSTKF